jgi:hypothetical protein
MRRLWTRLDADAERLHAHIMRASVRARLDGQGAPFGLACALAGAVATARSSSMTTEDCVMLVLHGRYDVIDAMRFWRATATTRYPIGT